MSKTRTQLVNQALRNLGVLAAGQTASAEDFTTVNDLVGPVLSRLATEGIVDVGDYEAIEDVYFLPVAVFLADAAKEEFGAGPFDLVTAERQLRRATASGPTYETMRAEYF